MIDIRLLRENKNLIIENLKKRNQENLIELVDKALKIDEEWRKTVKEINQLRKEKNKLTRDFAQTKDEKLKEKAEELNKKIEELEKIQEKLISERDEILKTLPNLLHRSEEHTSELQSLG